MVQLVLKEFSNPLRVIPGYENLNIESNRKFNKASKELEEFLLGIIDEHNQKPTEAEQEDSDLLRLMSEANEDGLGLSNEEVRLCGKQASKRASKRSSKQSIKADSLLTDSLARWLACA